VCHDAVGRAWFHCGPSRRRPTNITDVAYDAGLGEVGDLTVAGGWFELHGGWLQVFRNEPIVTC